MRGWIKPKALQKGDVVGIVAPSDAVERSWVREGVKVLQSWGLKARLGKHLFASVGDFAAGSPEERREDLLKMIEDPEVKVIWCAIGGYAATEVLPVFTKEIVEKLRKNPKWFIGFSDVCVLLNALASFRMASIQGPNLTGLAEKDEKSREWVRKMLFGEVDLEIGSDGNWQSLIAGVAEGRLLVSNLDSLVTVLGTKFDPLMHGSGDLILGIEEWWIEKSTLQRQVDTILNHKRASRIKGMIIGRLVGIGESVYVKWGLKVTPEQLIEGRIRLRDKTMPCAVLSDFGHPEEESWLQEKFPQWFKKPERFMAIPNGINARLTVDPAGARLQFLEPITEPEIWDESVTIKETKLDDKKGDDKVEEKIEKESVVEAK